VKIQCGCEIPVGDPASSATKAVVAAMAEYTASGCTANCPPACTAFRGQCTSAGQENRPMCF
jgi:hypothetical protein